MATLHIDVTIDDSGKALTATFDGDSSVDKNGNIWFTQKKSKTRKNWKIKWELDKKGSYKFTGDGVTYSDPDGQISGRIKNDYSVEVTNANSKVSVVTYSLWVNGQEIHPMITNRDG